MDSQGRLHMAEMNNTIDTCLKRRIPPTFIERRSKQNHATQKKYKVTETKKNTHTREE